MKIYSVARLVALLLLMSARTNAATCLSEIKTALQFKHAFSKPQSCHPEVRGLVGRVLRGKLETDFRTLSDDSDRRLIFLMGSDGLQKILGRSTRQILLQIGYPTSYIDRLAAQKTKTKVKLKLVVFKMTSEEASADWDHTLELVESTYPSVEAKLKAQSANLKKDSFDKIDALGPEKMSTISKAGSSNPNFIDLKRLESRTGTEWEVRAFLYNVVYLNELFSGTGKSHSEDGQELVSEYISKNSEISSLKEVVVFELPPIF